MEKTQSQKKLKSASIQKQKKEDGTSEQEKQQDPHKAKSHKKVGFARSNSFKVDDKKDDKLSGQTENKVAGRFNEHLKKNLIPPRQSQNSDQSTVKTAFGYKLTQSENIQPNSQKPSKIKPPLIPRQIMQDGFDKKEWIREFKMLEKEALIEERDRFRPLLCLKRDFDSLILECEKIEKKDLIEFKREEDAQLQFMQKQQQDIRQIRIMTEQASKDQAVIDRIHQKVQTVEQSIKNFKIKSRSVYEELAEEEHQLEQEINALLEKYESWEQQGPEFLNEYQNYRIGQGSKYQGKNNQKSIRQRPSSYNGISRINEKKKNLQNGHADSDIENEEEGEDSEQVKIDKGELIKYEIEKIEDSIQRLGGVLSCGWDHADHKDFLRIRTKHNDKVKTVAFLNDMKRAVPTADEESIKAHVQTFQHVQELIEKKKKLLQEYKEFKKDQLKPKSKVDSRNLMYTRLNGDLNLDEADYLDSESRSIKHISAAEREKRKEQLEKWKEEREKKLQADLADKAEQEMRIKKSLKKETEEKRREVKEKVEEFKFRKEIDKQTEKMLENMEKNKLKEKIMSQEQIERIQKREEDLYNKKIEAIQNKMKEEQDRAARIDGFKAPSKQAEKLKEKVPSKLLAETKAQLDKKRDKFDPKKDGPGKDAMTMGGNILGLPMRSMPGWRAGL